MSHSTREDERPGFMFFPKDWLSDTGLILSEPEEKGIWIDMLCYMFTSPIRGAILNPDGSIMDTKGMAKLLRIDEKRMAKVLGKLLANKVARQLENGTIINWRMYQKDKDLSQKRREAGLKGAIAKWEKEEDGKRMASGMAKVDKDGFPGNAIGNGVVGSEKDKYLDFVFLSSEEFKKLEERFGEEGVKGYIDRLNKYIGKIGEKQANKKYASHYFVILSWADKDQKEGKDGKGGLSAEPGKYQKAGEDRIG